MQQSAFVMMLGGGGETLLEFFTFKFNNVTLRAHELRLRFA